MRSQCSWERGLVPRIARLSADPFRDKDAPLVNGENPSGTDTHRTVRRRN
jgi:hypothetical protein